jgi:hypothetical protein
MIFLEEILQSPHLLEERLGNRLLVERIIQQQSRPMELFGLGVLIIVGNLEQMILQIEELQSPHLPEEPIGNCFLWMIIPQQSRLMELFGFGVILEWGGGQLGILIYVSRSTPVTTFAGGNNWKQVSAGNTYTAIQTIDYI